MTVLELIAHHAEQLLAAGVSFGHGTDNAHDEASWLVLWKLGLPLDSSLDALTKTEVSADQLTDVATLFEARISSRKPAAYLTQEAWLQGVPFYVDERVIVPRSLIAELIVQADTAANIDPWLSEHTARILDLCTGNGSLAIICALAFPDVQVDGADVSAEALAVAEINVRRHGLQARVRLMCSDGLNAVDGPYDLIVCNPPYVNALSMAELPAEYLAEPELALAGGEDGMDFVRHLLRHAPAHMTPSAVLVLEIGNEREFFEAAFPQLEVFWLDTSAGADQVLLVTRESLLSCVDM